MWGLTVEWGRLAGRRRAKGEKWDKCNRITVIFLNVSPRVGYLSPSGAFSPLMSIISFLFLLIFFCGKARKCWNEKDFHWLF